MTCSVKILSKETMEHTKQKFPLVAQVREMNEKN